MQEVHREHKSVSDGSSLEQDQEEFSEMTKQESKLAQKVINNFRAPPKLMIS